MRITKSLPIRFKHLATKTQTIVAVALLATAGLAVDYVGRPVSAATEPWLPGNVTQVDTGSSHTCAVAGGQAYCWGSNFHGQLGTGSNSNSDTPVAVDTSGVLSGKTVTAISVGNSHSCAIADGNVYCWGSNEAGRLGNNSTVSSTVPVAVNTDNLSGKEITTIDVGPFHACVIADGSAYCWGENYSGEIGNGTTQNAPIPVAAGGGALNGKPVADISAGNSYTCAVADGRAYCWGDNSYGQLGSGPAESSLSPVEVVIPGQAEGSLVTDISAGMFHTCAVADGRAYCWGDNYSGQLGSGTLDSSTAPVAVDTSGVLSGKSVSQVVAGYSHGCAIADEQAYCWGNNDIIIEGSGGGELGDGTREDSLVPVKTDDSGILAGKIISSLSAYNRTCVLADDQVACWGTGYAGIPVHIVGAHILEVFSVTPDKFSKLAPEMNYFVVTVNGDGFEYGATVTFGGVDVYAVQHSSTTIEAYVPIGVFAESTTVDVTVTNPSGKSYTLEGALTYEGETPVVHRLNPSIVAADGTDRMVYIEGGGFDENATVSFGGKQGTIDYVSSVGISAWVSTEGITETTTVDVTVTNPGGKSHTLPGALTFLSPGPVKVTDIEFIPNHIDDGQMMKITGSNFIVSEGDLQGSFTRSLIHLNGQELPFCATTTGMTAEELSNPDMAGVPANLVSDTPACYYIVELGHEDMAGTSLLTPTQALIWLPEDFDITKPGTVSVNGSPEFSFNQPTEGPGGPGQPNEPNKPDQPAPQAEVIVEVDKKQLSSSRQTISKRPTFSGTAPAHSTVTVTVHSDPVSCTTTADANGYWSCTLPADLATGDHTVYVVVTTAEGDTVELEPSSVTVDGGSQAVVDGQIPGVPNTGFGFASLVEGDVSSNSLVATAVVLLAATSGAGLILRRHLTARRR